MIVQELGDTHMGDQDGVTDFSLAIVGFWGVNQDMDNLSVSPLQ